MPLCSRLGGIEEEEEDLVLSWPTDAKIPKFVFHRFHIVYRQAFEVPQAFHFEPSLDAVSLRSDVTIDIPILPL